MIRLLALLALVTVPVLDAQTRFSLKNTEPSALFYWWDAAAPEDARGLLGALAASGGRHPVAPGETVTGVLAPGHRLVGVFVSGSPVLQRTPLAGGWLPAEDLPGRGTLLVDQPRFAAAVRGREVPGTLAEWGLTPPSLVLDGRSDDWKTVPNLREWGPSFQPEDGPWPLGVPRIRSLQAVERDGVFWVRAVFDASGAGDLTGSLLLNRPGASLEFPLGGTERRVWQWLETGSLAAGSRLLTDGVLEAWVPWDRLPAADRTAWLKVPAEWVLAVAGPGAAVRTYWLGGFRGEDLP